MRNKLVTYALPLALVAFTALSLGTIDWSSFTDALTSVLPDVIALAAAVVATVVTISVIMKAVPYVARLATRFIH
jgi:hypothetical protein